MKNKSKGQISAEMILVLAILLGLVFIVANRLQETATVASDKVHQQSLDIFNTIDNITMLGKASTGETCSFDSDCASDLCSLGICQ